MPVKHEKTLLAVGFSVGVNQRAKMTPLEGREFNRRFIKMLSHYLVEPTACPPAAVWEKRQVENQVGNALDWVFVPRLKFKNVNELNRHLTERCLEISKARAHHELKERRIFEMFEQERQMLRLMGCSL